MDEISKAASLAFWLITEKNKPKNVAVIIAMNKYGLSRFSSQRQQVKDVLKELLKGTPLFPEVRQ